MTSETIDPGRPPEGGGAGRESSAPNSAPESAPESPRETVPGSSGETRIVTVRLDDDTDRDRLSRATGTDDPFLRDRLINDMLGCLALANGADEHEAGIAVRAALAALESLAPGNAAEGMMAVQMVGCHAAATDCLRRAARNEGPAAARDWNLRQAARLMALYDRQLAALDRRQEARTEREKWEGLPGSRDRRPTASANRPVYRHPEQAAAPAKRRKARKKATSAGIPDIGMLLSGKQPHGTGLKDGLLGTTHLNGKPPNGKRSSPSG